MVPNPQSNLNFIQARIASIPNGWKLCEVSDALNICNNFRKPISKEVRDTIKGIHPYYGPTKIQDYISEYEQDGIYALIGEYGDHFLKYNKMAQTQFISGKCTAVNNHAHILESSSFCDSEWFYNYFKHRDITNFLSRQGAGRFKLNKATLEKLPMLVPPQPEQRKIALILSTWDKAIATTEKLTESSKQQKKALMQQLLTGKKRLINPETGIAFKGDWEKTCICKISQVVTGNTPATKNKDFYGGDYLFVSPADLGSHKYISKTNKSLTALGFEKTRKIRKGSSLFTCIGSTIGKLGMAAEKLATYNKFSDANAVGKCVIKLFIGSL